MSDNHLLDIDEIKRMLERLDQQAEQLPQEDTPLVDKQQARTVINVFFVDEPSTEEQEPVTVESTLTSSASDRTPPAPEPSLRPVKPAAKGTQGNAFFSLAVFSACLLMSLVLMFLFIIPSFFPIATVTIMPRTAAISTKATIQLVPGTPTGEQIHGNLLPPLTLSLTKQALATGHRHQDAAQAEGTISFYNGLFTSQTVLAGTVLTGSDGVQIITDQDAVIPAANPPFEGQVTVYAHSLHPGSQGNIEAFDIDKPCCFTAVKAVNTDPFQGGQNERNYLVVTKGDIQSVVIPLTASLTTSEQGALHAQLAPGEGLVTLPCSQQIQSDHQPGDEADMVQVTVSETCEAVAYTAHDLYQDATRMITKEAIKRFGTAYSLIGNIAVSVLHATITDHTRGIATIAMRADATYVYQIPQGKKHQIIRLIAGKTKQQALATLSRLPGIQASAIAIKGNAATLPDDPGRITIVLVYRQFS